MDIERLSTGVKELDRILGGGIPRGFLVAVAGEPGTGKTVFCLHFSWQGVLDGDKVIYVTTEESRESVIRQAETLGMRLGDAVTRGKAIVIDALLGSDRWSLRSLNPEDMVEKVVEAKRELGYGRARLVIDSMSAFWLDKPAMARKYSYYLKKVLHKWDFTILATTQYAITTSITGDQLVAVKGERGVEVLPIRELSERFRDSPSDLACLSLGGDLKVRWSKVLAVSEHEPREPIYRIRLEGGRSIEVTGDHSIYVWRDGIEVIPAREVRVGDFLISLRRLTIPWAGSRDIDVVSSLMGSGMDPSLIYLRGVDDESLSDPKVLEEIRARRIGHDTLRHYWRRQKVLPLEVLLSAGVTGFNASKVTIAFKSRRGRVIAMKKGVKTNIPVDGRLGRLLGYYVAEGHLKDNKTILTFGSHEMSYARDAADLFREIFGVDAKVRSVGSKLMVEVDSAVVRRIFEEILGVKTGAHAKEVPPLIFLASRDVKINFLIGLYRGDGHLRRSGWDLTLTTASERLLNGVILLLLELGVVPHISRRGNAYNLVVSYAGGLERLKEVVEAIRPGFRAGSGLTNSALEGIPRELLVEILSSVGTPRSGTYTNLNKVRTSYWRAERSLKSGPVKKFLELVDGNGNSEISKELHERGLIDGNGGLTEKGLKLLEKIELARSLIHSDIMLLRVKEIEVVEGHQPVYDVAVEGEQNFFAGLGWILCHNSEAFGFGLEHIADGIIRFRRVVRGGRLKRFLLVEKMRQTPHDLRMYEVVIEPGRGMRLVGPVGLRAEDFALPQSVTKRILEAKRKSEEEVS